MYNYIFIMMFFGFIVIFFIKNNNIKKIFCYMIILLFWWVGGLAYKVGLDNYWYEHYYLRDLRFLKLSKETFEIGYVLINQFFNNLNLNYYTFRGIIFFIEVILIYKGIKSFFKKKDEISWIFILLYSYGIFYFYYFSFIRQSIAISIIIYSLQYIYMKKKWKYLFWIIIASLFHKSSIIFIGIYFLFFLFQKIKSFKFFLEKKEVLILGIILLKILFITSIGKNMIYSFLEKIKIIIPRLSYYINFNQDNIIISIYDIIFILILTIYLNNIKLKREEKFIVDYFFLIYIVYNLFINFSFFNRIRLYTDFLVFYNLLIVLNKYKIKNFLKVLCIILVFLQYNLKIQNGFLKEVLFPYNNYIIVIFKKVNLNETQQYKYYRGIYFD